jgi:hypothetical protein
MNFQVTGTRLANSPTMLKHTLPLCCMDLVIQLYLYNSESEQNYYHREAKKIRQMEIDECFLRNLHHPLIQTVHVLCETEQTREHYTNLAKYFQKEMKCVVSLHGKQPTYAELIKYVQTSIPDNRIVCIQNSDIYIDHGMSREFLESKLTPTTLIALTRHEHTNDSHSECNVKTCPLIWDYMGSHDTFIFRTPVPANFPIETLHYPQNVYGGETLFMKAFKDSGKELMNPCFDIRIFHRHQNRVTFSAYPTLAEGDLCHINPIAPEGRDDIQSRLKTLYND